MSKTFSPRNGQWVLVAPAEFATAALAEDALYRFEQSVARLDRNLAKKTIDQAAYDKALAEARAQFEKEAKIPNQSLGLSGAHRAANGDLVGIYQKSGVDATGRRVPAHVALCKPNGQNLRVLDDETNELILVALKPEALELSPLLDKADLPPGRVVDENWTPQA